MIIVDPKKLRKYKKENKLKDNRLHKSAKKKARRIAERFHLKITEEAILNPYILDLYIPKIKVGFEIDGSVHKKTQNYDERRDAYLSQQYGVLVLRFTPDEIKNGIFNKVVWDYCYRWLIKHIKEINQKATDAKQTDIIPVILKAVS